MAPSQSAGRLPRVLGLACSHNGAACLLEGERVVAAIQEERLTRRKRCRLYGSLPSLAVRYCLEAGGIEAQDLDLVVACVQGATGSPLEDLRRSPLLAGLPHLVLPHHLGHAIGAFATSGFSAAAVLVIDGLGSPYEDLPGAERAAVRQGGPGGWETASLYDAAESELHPLDKLLADGGRWLWGDLDGMRRFGSLGGLFAAASWRLFGDHDQPGKVMALAGYGEPTLPVEDFFTLRDDIPHFLDRVPGRFRGMSRTAADDAELRDLAASTQRALEEGVLALARRLRRKSPHRRLCYAGGVALNVRANERLIREAGFDEVYIQPAAEDSGTALGAAYHGLWQLQAGGGRSGSPNRPPLRRDALGRGYAASEIDAALAAFPTLRPISAADPVAAAVDLLVEGKAVGLFQNGSELGPRALGQRSILFDPRRSDGRRRLSRIKNRDAFQPFAPAILAEHAADWLDLEGGPTTESPFMLRARPFRPERASQVPAVVHTDGTGRWQTVTPENGRLHALIHAFHLRTDVPLLLNTSFNGRGEPIVETPEQALLDLLATDLDAVLLEDQLVSKGEHPPDLLDLVPRWAPEVEESILVHADPLRAGTAEGGAFLRLRRSTPHGVVHHPFSPQFQPLLDRVDGQRSGREIAEALRAANGWRRAEEPGNEDFREAALSLWTDAAGEALLLEGGLGPLEVVEALYRQRKPVRGTEAVRQALLLLGRCEVLRFSPPNDERAPAGS